MGKILSDGKDVMLLTEKMLCDGEDIKWWKRCCGGKDVMWWKRC